ncbi:MAG: hypothetical protein J6Y19_12005 [Kiritimatiellae bacterium]|nr:hypothetical protein [Kiritimatiellia bacterium]
MDDLKQHGWGWRVLGSWWVLPVLHMAVVLTGAMVGVRDKACPFTGKHMDAIVGALWLFALSTAACMPLAVVFQLVCKSWKTALATALFSAVALTPLVLFLFALSTFRLN